ncbi:MAG: hypothetical protein ACTSYX_06480, partial [Candidatus Thorarchaeota archaeon]
IKSLQQESGGFSLMAGEDANPLMTGYALFALGIVGLDIKDSIVKSAIDYLEAVKAKTGAFGYHLDSSASLGPTAVIAHALDALWCPSIDGTPPGVQGVHCRMDVEWWLAGDVLSG